MKTKSRITRGVTKGAEEERMELSLEHPSMETTKEATFTPPRTHKATGTSTQQSGPIMGWSLLSRDARSTAQGPEEDAPEVAAPRSAGFKPFPPEGGEKEEGMGFPDRSTAPTPPKADDRSLE